MGRDSGEWCQSVGVRGALQAECGVLCLWALLLLLLLLWHPALRGTKEWEAVVGSNEVQVQVGADAGEKYASAEDFAGVVVVRIGGSGVLGQTLQKASTGYQHGILTCHEQRHTGSQ